MKRALLLWPVLAALVLTSGCAASTSDSVTSPRGGSAAAPAPAPSGHVPSGQVGDGSSDYTTYTSFQGPFTFKINESYGFTSTSVDVQKDGNGVVQGFTVNFVGPLDPYRENDPLQVPYARGFNYATQGHYIYHGSGDQSVEHLADDYRPAPITGYVCGDLSSGSRTGKFCVARYNGFDWWHYFGGPDWAFDEKAEGPALGVHAGLCQKSNLNVCVGGYETSAGHAEYMWNYSCTGDLYKELSPGCAIPQIQARAALDLYAGNPTGRGLCSNGSAFAPYTCALISILPNRNLKTIAKGGKYTVNDQRFEPWGRAVVCGKPTFTSASGEIAAYYPGEGDRNMAVLLRSPNGRSDASIRGTLNQDVAPKGNCADDRDRVRTIYSINWNPGASRVVIDEKLPGQDCAVPAAPAPTQGARYDCSIHGTYIHFRDEHEQMEVAAGFNQEQQAANDTFFLAFDSWLNGIATQLHQFTSYMPIMNWLGSMSKEFSQAILQTGDPDAILYTTINVGPTAGSP